jgi:hypothetical protein
MKNSRTVILKILAAALVAFISAQACTYSLFDIPSVPGISTQTPIPVVPSSTPRPVSQTTFITTLPEQLQAGESLAIALLDEVTGLSLNATYYPMSPRDALTYTAVLPLPYNSVVKYRYVRRGAVEFNEDTTRGTSIRYRLYHSAGPAEVQDIIADWADKSYTKPSGSIIGQVFNADTGSPLPNLMVNAGGVQSLTDSSGRFELPGLPGGTHNLIVYSLDGLYQPFQQGATVGEGKVTQVDVRVRPARLVNVTFNVAIPAETVPGVPVRIAGNLLQLGNTFADLQGGLSTNADRMPIMSLQPDGRYSITLSLPADSHLQYKYTLGDGFWNAEHLSGGGWVLRDIIIPTQDTVLQDTVETWAAGNSSPIQFEVTIPSVTPPGDIIYMQFNPYGWTEPIPMWPLGNNRWAYKLYSPLNMLGSFGYRYCRNGQCGSADDVDTVGYSTNGRQAITSLTGQDIQDTVRAWKWFENPEPVTLVGASITPRAGFSVGVEFQPTFRPNWSYYAPQAFANTQALGASQIVLTPGWTYSSLSPLTFAPSPGQDPLWIDSAIMISQARALGLNVAIFPTPHFPPAGTNPADSPLSSFWKNAPRDAQWWQTWFDRYHGFAVHYADLASQTGAQSLILGGDWIAPALPGGKLADGSPSNLPADAEAQWKAIIADTRAHFSGKVYWAMPYIKADLQTPLNLLKEVDGIYLLWSAALSNNPSATKTDYANEAGRILDNEISPLVSLVNKPLLLAVAYPSATGAASGCISNGSGGCLDLLALSPPNPDVGSVNIDLQLQADIYESILTAVNARPWISGFISRGFHPPVALQDKSVSVHSKPAADILWYWFPRMVGTIR